MPNDIDPVVLLKPEGIFSLKNPKTRIFLLVVILFCLAIAIYIGIQLIIKELNKPKILAYVNNEPISEKFLKDKMANVCLVEKSDNKSQALEKWIDFLVLKNGAKELGIEAIGSENSAQKTKTCPEEYQQRVFKNAIRQEIIPFRKVEYLIVDSSKEKELSQLVKNYDPKKYNSLMSAAAEFISKPKQATSSAAPSYTILQRFLTFDADKTNEYQNPLILETAFSLKTGEISKILPMQKGGNQNKLVLRIFQAGDNKKFTSMDDWFKEIKSQTKIVRLQ